MYLLGLLFRKLVFVASRLRSRGGWVEPGFDEGFEVVRTLPIQLVNLTTDEAEITHRHALNQTLHNVAQRLPVLRAVSRFRLLCFANDPPSLIPHFRLLFSQNFSHYWQKMLCFLAPLNLGILSLGISSWVGDIRDQVVQEFGHEDLDTGAVDWYVGRVEEETELRWGVWNEIDERLPVEIVDWNWGLTNVVAKIVEGLIN